MIIPIEVIRYWWQLLRGKTGGCKHHRKMNPHEKAWKDCCKFHPSGVLYKCCKCGKRREWL